MAQQIDIVANLLMKVDGAEAGINKLKSSLSKLKIPEGLENSFKKSFANLDSIFARYKSQVEKGFNTKGDVTAFSKTSKELDAELNRVSKHFTELTGKQIDFKVNSQDLIDAQNKLNQLVEAREKLSTGTLQMKINTGGKMGTADIETLLKKFEELAGASTKAGQGAGKALISLRSGNTTAAITEVNQLISSYKNLGKAKKEAFEGQVGSNVTSVFQQILQAVTQLDAEFTTADGKIKQVQNDLANTRSKQIEEAGNAASRAADAFEKEHSAVSGANGALLEHVSATQRAADEVKQLQQSTQYFFSLRNMINLLKRGISEAVQTVKELDAAMTETAVVTDYSVSDMWSMLPQYTAQANELGATIQDMYESTTLYYQQGLQTDQAMGIAAETMKMARIAGLEAKDATDMMTAALRGFNMELNNTSAQRINDVYSNLAAKTASDTNELGSAMQRTASIAYSAGMSFEGTAAFLAQAIETTREPAENIGTAMKTIVARFQEMKKNPLEITEVDGEEVSYNKVDTALQSIGVSLKDTNGQFRELDQVFLDISRRWDGLTQTQQRYIATIAAGSRQQSRFIAMMNNYDRTVELMGYANNSEGASTEQFGKTLESLQAKINEFQNAWKQFLMGIMNDTWTKRLVDGGTAVLNIVNSIINALSFGGKAGLLKSALSIFTAFTALKGAGRLANRAVGGLGGLIDPTSTGKAGWRNGAIGSGKNLAQAQAISNPIVQAIHQLQAAVTGKQASSVGDNGVADYKANLRKFRNESKKEGATISEAFGTLKGLSGQQMQYISRSNAGRMSQIQRSLADTDLGKTRSLQLMAAINQGQINGNQIASLNKANLGKVLGTKEAEEYSDSFVKTTKTKMPSLWDAQVKKMRGEMWQSTDEEIQKLAQETAGKSHADLVRKFNGTDEEGNKIENPLFNKKYAEYAKENLKAVQEYNKEQAKIGNVPIKPPTGFERFQQGISQLGGSAITAGQGLSALGSTLNSMGFETAGLAVSTFGNALTNLGMVATGLPKLLSMIASPAGLAVTAIAGTILLANKKVQDAKEAAEKTIKDYKDAVDKAESNISKLKSYQEELAQLSKGVDSNGNNISLDDSQYQRYLEIVDDIAAINPKIVEGYNAQGHAIINNNAALTETLKLQEEIRDTATKNYLNPKKGLQKLINARNVDKNYQASTTSYSNNNYKTGVTPLTDNVIRVAKELKKADWFDESMLESYGIHSLDSLLKGEEQAVNNFVKYQDKINAQLSEIGGDKITKGFIESFDNLGEQTELFNEAIQPVYDNLLTQASQSPLYDSIADEFKGALQTGLKDLASQDLSASEMSQAANTMVARFANLTTGSGKYADALKIVEDAQNEFSNTLNETEYKANVQPAIDDLTKLKEEALEEGGAYGDALAEYLDNQIQRITNFTKEGSANLTEALNTATDEIAAAEGALESFNSATEKDFSTAAEGMKGIFDKTTETFKDSYGTEIQKHAEGMGDATFWTGADALLSEKAIKKATKGKGGYEAAEAVAKKIKNLEPMLREGQEGFDAFTDRVLANADAMDKLAEAGVTYDKESGLITNIPDDQWHNVAEALGISDDLLTSMLNKGRQFADISFMNVEEARKALASSDFTIKGTTAASGEQQKVYVKESTLRQQLSEAGYVRKEQQDEQIKKLNKQNIDLLKPAEEYKKGSEELKKKFDDMGAKTLPDLIRTLNDTGDFNRDEIKAYADKLGMLGDEQRFDSLYSSIIEATKNPEVAKQTSILSSINAKFAALLDTRTGEQAEKDFKEQREDLYGKKGEHDTEAQAFGDGFKINEDGTKSKLTAGEYEETKKHLQELGQSYRDTAAIAVEKAKTAADAEEKLHWQKVAEMAEKDADYIDILLDRGAKAFKKNQDEIDKEINAKKSKDKNRKQQNEDKKQQSRNKAQAYVDEHGFLNTNINNRQEINWGKDSTQNKNFEAAATWFKNRAEAEKELNNSISTYLSSTNTYTDKTGGEFSLAFTPILQGTDGRGPQVLSKDTVNSYFDEIIKQATDEHGKINIDKLIELDETGIEGFESKGERIRGLLMGIIEGENSGEVAGAIGQLEHNLEEAKQKAKETEEATRKATEKAAKESVPKVTEKTVETAKKVTQTTNETINKQVNETEESTTYTAQETPEYARLSSEWTKFKQNPVMDLMLNATANEGNTPELKEKIDDIYTKFATPPVLTVNSKDAITKIDTANRAIGTIPSKKSITLSATDKITSTLGTIGSKIASIARKAAGIAIGGGGGFRGTKVPQTSRGIPTFGSAARGRYGTVGPKNKGGLTLTGEKGFEIAWLPSENRSMIVGAGGPQMISLPGDAVIYNHEQSKDILKRKGIPAGSHAAESATGSSYKKKYISYTSSASTTTKNKQDKKTSQSVSKAAKTVETVSAKAGKVFVWWENMARSVEKAQRDAEKNQKTLERLLKNFGTTLSEYDKASKPYKEALEKQIDLANQRIQKANDELHITDYGADSKKSNDYLAAIGARQEISYEITKTKKSKKGKKKTTTETKKETLNLAKYITKTADGIYQLNQGEIDRVAKSNKSKAEAIKTAAEKQLNDLYSKLKSAEDDRIKAEEALQQFYNDAYETFYRWEKSITQVYLLGQQLEKLSNLNSIYEAAVEVQTSKLEAGFTKAIDVLPQITSALERNRDLMIEQVQTNDAKMQAAWQEYNDSLSLRAVTEKYLANQNSTDAAYDYDVMKNTLAFLQNAGLDQSNFNLDTAAKTLEELYANQWKGDDYDKIKEGLDKIAEKQGDYYSTLADTYSSLTEVYQKIEEYQSYMADFEGTLIKGIEDQANKQIDKLNKLNNSLSTAAKDIIDEVKRKLDERRKQEDNAKTENEISQKQQRLAALRADTAGGHATEIAQLEKEIADSQQSYGRTLEDQLLDRLSQQEDNAEKQRERQIALLEAQRDFAAATGSNVDQINKWLQDPVNYAEEIKSAFLANNNFEELGELERKQLLEEFESKFGTYLAYAEVLPSLEQLAGQEWPESISTDVPNSLSNIEDQLDGIIGLLSDTDRLTAEINSDAMTLKEFKEQGADAITARALSTDQGNTYTAKDFIDAEYTPQETKAAGFSASDFYNSDVSYEDAKKAGFGQEELLKAQYSEAATDSSFAQKTSTTSTGQTAKDKYLKYLQDLAKSGTMNKATFSTAQSLANAAGLSARTYMQNLADIDKPKNITWAQVIKAAKDNGFSMYRMALTFTSKAFQTGYDTVYGKGKYKKNRAYALKYPKKYSVYKYASGGLASKTGPAWLDGTPSKPELVLNAQDTKNFIALKDILAHAMGSTNNINNSYGGNATYEININVDHINNDYDVDKITKRVKENIIKDSSYRNVTQVRKFR